MKRKVIESVGVCGLQVEFNFIDVYALSTMRKSLEELKNNHEEVAAYDKIPYDERKNIARPGLKVMPDDQLQQIINFFKKLTLKCEISDIFEEGSELETQNGLEGDE